MKYRAITAFSAAMLAAGSLVLSAAPASARNGPPVVGCTTGSSCMVELNWNVTYTGSSGGHNGVVVPPPPCIGVPVGDAYVGSQAILSLFGNTAPLPSDSPTPITPTPTDSATPSDSATPTDGVSPTDSASATPSPTATMTASTAALILRAAPALNPQQQAIVDQAQGLLATHPKPSGEWYQIAGDPYASAKQQAKCTSLPPYIWQAGAAGTIHIAGFNIPPRTLAGLAYSQLTTAGLGQVTLNPVGANDTNLPTFIDVAMTEPTRGLLSVTTDGDPYVWATAMTPDGTAATVWAWVTSLTITPGTTNATTFNDKRCATAHLSNDEHTYMLGSRYTADAMAQVGVGQQIDCGVTYTAPGKYNLTANVTWDACWAKGQATPGGPPAKCQPVPGAGGLAASTTQPVQVNVRDIQSVNG
jgi:hypothetical protein